MRSGPDLADLKSALYPTLAKVWKSRRREAMAVGLLWLFALLWNRRLHQRLLFRMLARRKTPRVIE